MSTSIRVQSTSLCSLVEGYTAVLWQKEATLENEISRKWTKYVCHIHWYQCNISICLDLTIFQQDECFCSKLGVEVECAQSNLKPSLPQIWVICHLLPFVRVGQIMALTWSVLLLFLQLTCPQGVSAVVERNHPLLAMLPWWYVWGQEEVRLHQLIWGDEGQVGHSVEQGLQAEVLKRMEQLEEEASLHPLPQLIEGTGRWGKRARTIGLLPLGYTYFVYYPFLPTHCGISHFHNPKLSQSPNSKHRHSS